jgi:hypothetical protein
MIIKHKYNGKEYTLTNENLHEGDKVYGISWGRTIGDKHNHEYFDWRLVVSGWISEPHTITDMHYSKDDKAYEISTNHGYGPREHYFKILYIEPILKLRPPTGTAEAMTFMMEHEMKKLVRKSDFIYYDERTAEAVTKTGKKILKKTINKLNK